MTTEMEKLEAVVAALQYKTELQAALIKEMEYQIGLYKKIVAVYEDMTKKEGK